jgi:CRISPR system Cascade subunit CasA
VNFDRREVSEWWKESQRHFRKAWHADFFPWLWRTLDHPEPDTARLEWLQALRDKALAVFNHAVARYPGRAGRRYRALVRAKGMFTGSLYRNFPQLKEDRSDSTTGSKQVVDA